MAGRRKNMTNLNLVAINVVRNLNRDGIMKVMRMFRFTEH